MAPGGDPAWHTTNAPSGLRKGCLTPHGLADGSPLILLAGTSRQSSQSRGEAPEGRMPCEASPHIGLPSTRQGAFY